MGLLNLFTLEKLAISAYGNRMRIGLPQGTFEAMFNPASFSMKHQNVFQNLQGIHTAGRRAMFTYGRSEELSLSLIIDGTGVSSTGVVKLFGYDSVAKQIEKFLDLCFHVDGDLHEPRFLKIQWGDGALKDFDCRLQSVDIKYTSFDRSGAPLRAELETVFVEDQEAGKKRRKLGLSSPDVSHTRVVKSGDTLPLLCKEIYGSASHYIRVAQANGLDDFRNLTPGQTLVFPPLSS